MERQYPLQMEHKKENIDDNRRIPVRIDSRTVILVKEGADIKKHIEKYKKHKFDSPGMVPWSW